MAGEIKELTDANFSTEVLQSLQPVLVFFWANWSNPSKAQAPLIEEAARTNAGSIKVGRLNVDENTTTTAQHNVQSLPTILIFKGGSLVQSLVGSITKAKLETAIQALKG